MSMPPLAASVSQGAGDPQPIEQPVPPSETPPGQPADEALPEGDQPPPQPGEPERPRPRLVDELRAERAAKRQVEAELAQARVQQQQLQPLLERVMTDPSIMTLLTQQQGGQQVDPELVDLAQSLGLYTAQGQPDLQAASRVLGFVDRRAQAHAQQMIGPVQQHSVHQAANQVRSHAMQAGVDQGIRPETLDKVISLLPPELIVQPNVAALAVTVAAGIERMQGTSSPPLMTEGVGFRPRNGALPTALTNVLKARGMNERDIQTAAGKFQPGGFNPLE
jgi:hypothetical protein